VDFTGVDGKVNALQNFTVANSGVEVLDFE
jgi:hypothetical protein